MGQPTRTPARKQRGWWLFTKTIYEFTGVHGVQRRIPLVGFPYASNGHPAGQTDLASLGRTQTLTTAGTAILAEKRPGVVPGGSFWGGR